MPRFAVRFTIGRAMWVIAVLALLMAMTSVPFTLLLSVVLIGIVSLIGWASRAFGISRSRAAFWALAGYPWFLLASLYMTWLLAWWTLGHRPRYILDDPKFINVPVSFMFGLTALTLFGAAPAAIACLIMMAYEGAAAIEADRPSRPNEVTRIVLLPLLLWFGAVSVISFDPGLIWEWFID